VAGHLVHLNRVTQKLSQALGRTPMLQEIAQAACLSIEDVERYQLLQQTTSTVSTEQGLGDSDLTVGDSLEQEVEPSAMHTMDQEAFLEQIEVSLAALSEKERTIISLHFGIGGEDPLTLEQIGRRFDPPISRERVRQLEERAFARIRERRREVLGGFLRGGDGA
jgi:RNA polymerase primary sigma factor